MPIIDLTDDEHAAVARAVRRVLDEDKFPHAPRLRPLRAALAKLDPASVPKPPPEPKRRCPRHQREAEEAAGYVGKGKGRMAGAWRFGVMSARQVYLPGASRNFLTRRGGI